MLFRHFKFGLPNSATMHTALIDGNYFPWERWFGYSHSHPDFFTFPFTQWTLCLSHYNENPIFMHGHLYFWALGLII